MRCQSVRTVRVYDRRRTSVNVPKHFSGAAAARRDDISPTIFSAGIDDVDI